MIKKPRFLVRNKFLNFLKKWCVSICFLRGYLLLSNYFGEKNKIGAFTIQFNPVSEHHAKKYK